MRLKGSVLIVVLGLLAVLAVVGIAFVTMSSIESNTASNFALQAQFDLAADGAVDYVSQALVKDVWEFGTNPAAPDAGQYRTYTGYTLTGKYGTQHWDWPDPTKASKPLTDNAKIPLPDNFLAWSADWTVTPPQPATTAYSFRTVTPTMLPYFLKTWGGGPTGVTAFKGTGTTGAGSDGSPNNLGIPTGTQVLWYSPQNGLWIPELASPFENGIIRVSVTVLDHAGMVNLNTHGVPLASTSSSWPYNKGVGKGYFVCDVSPVSPGGLSNFSDITRLLYNSGYVNTYPGRWGDANGPVNTRLGELILQNPAAGASVHDRPFTLDDEFELRRLTGTYAKSRLENIAETDLDSNPDTTTAAKVKTRLGVTTVGWNAEVMPGQTGCTAKSDLNLAFDSNTDVNTVKFTSALDWGGVINQATYPNITKQFNANFHAFKERYKPSSGSYFRQYGGVYGARRQLILSKFMAAASVAAGGKQTWSLQAQVFYPWTGDYPGGPTYMDSSKYTITFWFSGGSKETLTSIGTGGQVPGKGVWGNDPAKTSIQNAGQNLSKITLEVTGGPTVDQITTEIGTVGTLPSGKYRLFGVYDDSDVLRGSDEDPTTAVTVVYIKGWQAGATATWTALQGGLTGVQKGYGIPIRFPHSVPDPQSTDLDNKWDPKTDGPLPPYSGPIEGTAKKGIFKAFLRVGDLNQVLCPATEAVATAYWPWIPTVVTASGTVGVKPTLTQEESVKWRWWPDTTPDALQKTAYTILYDSTLASNKRAYRRYNGGNVFCVDSPWLDSFDNDGDGFKDDLDTAVDRDKGRFCGKEIRVAGRINLNTATDQALKALSFGVYGDAGKLPQTTMIANRPFRSPVEILNLFVNTDSPNTDCMGPIEKREDWYTRISNIATVRSDTFSIYGTVQYVQVLPGYGLAAATDSLSDIRVGRTRRFWALIDRSPIFTNPPSSATAFIRPRVLNFQWLD